MRSREIKERLENLKEIVLSHSSYEDLLNNVNRYVKCFLEKVNMDIGKFKIIKVHGIGKFIVCL